MKDALDVSLVWSGVLIYWLFDLDLLSGFHVDLPHGDRFNAPPPCSGPPLHLSLHVHEHTTLDAGSG